MDSVLALHPVAPGLNLGRDTFSLLLSSWTVLRLNPPSAKKARDFANAMQRRPKPSTTKKTYHKFKFVLKFKLC